jgi:hypothetical protein
MSTILRETNGVRSRKPRRCCLCGDRIDLRAPHDVRVGVDGGDMWTIRMHPECHQHETRGAVDHDWWYEDVSDPAFDHKDAIAEYVLPA